MRLEKILTHIVLSGPVAGMTNTAAKVSLYVFDRILGLYGYSCVFMCCAHLQPLTNSSSMRRIQNYLASTANEEVAGFEAHMSACTRCQLGVFMLHYTDVRLPTDFIPNKA